MGNESGSTGTGLPQAGVEEVLNKWLWERRRFPPARPAKKPLDDAAGPSLSSVKPASPSFGGLLIDPLKSADPFEPAD